MDSTHLHLVMENFHLCSHLPIRAFDALGNELLLTGFDEKDALISSQYFPNATIREEALKLHSQSIVHYSAHNGVSFSLCPILKADLSQGIFVIGPYTTELSLKDVLLFKPAHCIDHLIGLVYIYEKQTTQLFFTPPCSNTSDEVSLDEESMDEHNYHVTKAEIYIEKHYAEPITLDNLSKHLGINKSYFCTVFKKVTKQSFCTYTNKIRVEKSKYLLTRTNDSILDIALATGFSSSSYFNTTFKKMVGKTPLEYRNDFKQQ